jgi:WD40 repeat protein
MPLPPRTTLVLIAAGLAAGAEPRLDRHGDPLPPGAVARLGTVRLRTAASVLALTPDGKTVLTVAGGRTVGRWDADTGRLLGEVHLPGPFAGRCWLSPDGGVLAVPEGDHLGLWETATGRQLRLLEAAPLHAAFSPDGRTLATAEYDRGGYLTLWDLAGGRRRPLARVPSYANDLAFSPDGRRLIAAIDNHSLRAWDVDSRRQLWQNEHWASHLAVSPDGKTLATDNYSGGRDLHLWDADSGRPILARDAGRPSSLRLAFAPDGRTLVQGTTHDVLVWDPGTGTVRRRLSAPGHSLAFAADGRSLFTLGPLLGRWDVASGKSLYPDTAARGHAGLVGAVAFAPDGKALASCGDDLTVRVWDLIGGGHRVLAGDRTPRPRAIRGSAGEFFTGAPTLAFTPDGGALLTGAGTGALRLREVAGGKEMRRFTFPPVKDRWTTVSAARLTADGRTALALGSVEGLGGSLELVRRERVMGWEAATGKEVLTQTVETPGASGGEFSPDGRLLALPETAGLRDLDSGDERPFADRPPNLGPPFAFSDDGRLLAAAEPGLYSGPTRAVRVLEVLTGRLLVRVEAALGNCPGLAFSPDGRMVAAPGSDALHVWESATGKSLLRLEARGRLSNWTPAGFAACLAFAPDGGTLATGHADGTVLVWDLDPARKALAVPEGGVKPEACWADLAAANPRTAYSAIDRLAGAPAAALPLLREKLVPVEVDPRWLAARLADLDSADYATREAASRILEEVVEAAEGPLRQALGQTRSAEVRARLGRLLASRQPAVPPPETVRRLRALAVLERIGSEKARAVLRRLAGGAAGARLTREAKAALERLERGR